MEKASSLHRSPSPRHLFCFPDMNGSKTLQGGLRIPEVDWLPISMGWFKLKMLYALGQPQGKFDQFLIGAVISSILSHSQTKNIEYYCSQSPLLWFYVCPHLFWRTALEYDFSLRHH